MRIMALIAAGVMATTAPALAEMDISFEWGDIPRCTSGRPNTVGNPQFELSGVPEGTASVEFRLKDLDAPHYNHGGAKLKITQSMTVPFGTFTYKSPCPPGGVHTYEWQAIARDAAGTVLDEATARRQYPE